MKTATAEQVIERFNVGEESTFRIEDSPKAFQILSDGLYSDKITAIIRELSCNAFDAHVQSGKGTQPFQVHLPNDMEPHFSVRDFGPGLPTEDIKTIYTVYFKSTKTNSNSYIGCLGLGSKSPFSYTDNFTVVSYHKGVKTTYSAFYNEDKRPMITPLGTESTTETGMEVVISVQRNDIYTFCDKAAHVFEYFRLHPTVTGTRSYIQRKTEYAYKGKGWGIRVNGYGVGTRAIMGNVSYPLNNFPGILSTQQKALIDCGMDIHFQIGDLEVAASRESLSYDKRTSVNIISRLNEIAIELGDTVSKKFDQCPSMWDARCLLAKLASGELNKLKPFLFESATWKKTKIPCDQASFSPSLKGVTLTHYYLRRNRTTRERTYTIIPEEYTKIYIRDVKLGAVARCRRAVADDRHKNISSKIYLFELDGTPESMQSLEKIKTDFGMLNEHISNVSILPTTERVAREPGAYNYNSKYFKKILCYDFSIQDYDQSASSYWKETTVDIHSGGIYVPLERYKINDRRPYEYMKLYIDGLRAIGVDLTKETVCGIKNGLLEQAKNSKKWMTPETFTSLKAKEFVDRVGNDEVAKMLTMQWIKNDHTSLLNVLVKVKNLSPDSPMHKFISDMIKYHAVDGRMLNSFLTNAQVDVPAILKSGHSFKKELADIFKHYPMLRAITVNMFELTACVKLIEDYVNLIDKSMV